MNDRTIIRQLLIGQWVLWMAGMLLNEFYLTTLPEPFRRFVDQNPFDLWNPAIVWPIAMVILVTMLFSYWALYRMRPGSGRLFLWVNLPGFLFGLFMPPTYESGAAYVLGHLGTVCFGMTIAWILLGRVPYVDGAAATTRAMPQHDMHHGAA